MDEYKSLYDNWTKPNSDSETKHITIGKLFSHKKLPATEPQPLRLRSPKKGFEKTVAEIIEEVLLERREPLLAKEIFDLILAKGRDTGSYKDFSSQLNTISKSKNRFHREKINKKFYWGLIEWRNDRGVGFNKYKFTLIK